MDKVLIFIKENKDILSLVISTIMMLFSVFVYRKTVERDCKNQTIKKLAEIRTEYRGFGPLSSEKKKRYIQELEFLSIGVEEKIYSFDIIKKMSKKRLVSQYDKYIEKFLKEQYKEDDYKSYKKMIKKLQNDR